MEENSIKNQMILSIKRDIQSWQKKLANLKARTQKKIDRLQAQIEEARGTLKAEEELTQYNTEKALKKLKEATGEKEWKIGDTTFEYLEDDSEKALVKADKNAELKDCEYQNPLKTLFKAEEERQEEEYRKQQVKDLPF